MEELALKYRPNAYEEMIGQDAVVASIKRVVSDRSTKAFCLTGPSGVGKTTLARIVAWDVGCTPENLVEVDGATYTGVDHWRSIMEGLRFKPLGGGTKVVIVDEAHMLSRNAWNSLLKIVEEGPKYVWWFFCTTESAKIPATIRTRCACYELGPVSEDDIHDRLEAILEEEEHEGVRRWRVKYINPATYPATPEETDRFAAFVREAVEGSGAIEARGRRPVESTGARAEDQDDLPF